MSRNAEIPSRLDQVGGPGEQVHTRGFHQRPEGGLVLMMAVHQVPSLTQERYEEVVRRLTGKSRIESASDLPFEGLLVHVAGQGKDGFCIVDVFESEEAVARFNQAMSSIPREVGIEEPPEFFPAHTFMASHGDA
jgi:hypothetical protein